MERVFGGSGLPAESLWWVWVPCREPLLGLGSLLRAFGGSGSLQRAFGRTGSLQRVFGGSGVSAESL